MALPLYRWSHQGWYAEHFVRVLAAAAGLQVGRMEPDVTGEDFIIGYPGKRGDTRHPKIEIQVKSWNHPRGSNEMWQFRGLNESQFNELAGSGFRYPRFLFLVVVPRDATDYARVDHDALHLSHSGYWQSFEDQQPITDPDPKKKVLVEVPKANLLTGETLLALIDKSAVHP